MSHNPYEPPKAAECERKPHVAPLPPSKPNALMLLSVGIVMLLTGAHFTDPVQMATIASPTLRLGAVALHLGGAVVSILGIYRVWVAMRAR